MSFTMIRTSPATIMTQNVHCTLLVVRLMMRAVGWESFGRPGLCVFLLLAAPLLYLHINAPLLYRPKYLTTPFAPCSSPNSSSTGSDSTSTSTNKTNNGFQPTLGHKSNVGQAGLDHLTPGIDTTIGGNHKSSRPTGPVPWQSLVEAVIAAGVPSSIEPLTTHLTYNSTATCLRLLQTAFTAAACVKLETHHSLEILWCTQSGNSRGTVLVYDVSSQPPDTETVFNAAATTHPQHNGTGMGHNIYRMQLSGPEIIQPAVHYCGRVAAAQYEVMQSGSYHLQVLQLHQDFSYSTPPLLLGDVHAAEHKVQVDLSLTAAAASAPAPAQPSVACYPDALQQPTSSNTNTTSSTSSNTRSSSVSHSSQTAAMSRRQLASSLGVASGSTSCPMCTGWGHAGRWVVNPAADTQLLQSVQTALQHTCVFKNVKPPRPYYDCPLALQNASTPDIEEHPILEWLPYGCKYRRITPAYAAQCKAVLQPRVQQQLPKRTVCFIGDSQTRHLYNQVVHLLEGPAAGYRKQVSGFTRAYQVLQSDVMRYVADNYGNDTALRLNTGFCSHVFVNFGQWPVSHAESQPWGAQHYAQAVQRLAQSMRAQQQKHGNKHFWLTTGPMPLNDLQQKRVPNIGQGVDHRTDPFILLFNKVGATIMHAHGIPVVDTYTMASALIDLSYDASHYIGTVGLAQAAMVANLFCEDLVQSNDTTVTAT